MIEQIIQNRLESLGLVGQSPEKFARQLLFEVQHNNISMGAAMARYSLTHKELQKVLHYGAQHTHGVKLYHLSSRRKDTNEDTRLTAYPMEKKESFHLLELFTPHREYRTIVFELV